MNIAFPLGASYYPPHHDREDWPRDIANMAAAGMNCIRSAELLASWDYIEKQPGQPDWYWLDQLFDTAAQHQLGILLGTGAPNPPIWLLQRYPDLQIIDRDGRRYPTGTVWGWACRNHPGYRAELQRYMRSLAERYVGHPALWAWQLDNEPGYPFIPRAGETRPRLHDYNPYTVTAFREWLRAKYHNDIEELNVAWRWDCTHHQYANWDLVDAPRSMPQEWGVVSAWLDWRTFLYQNMANFVAWQREIVRSVDPQRLTMTNIFSLAGCEVEMALDPWCMAQQADAIGFDMYPGIGRRLFNEPEYISMFLDMGRSTAREAGKQFWLPELESGPVAGWALGPDYTTTANDILRYNLEALAHGAKAILYQGYREWPCIPIHWGALADFQGKPTLRYHAATQVNNAIAAHAELFAEAEPLPPQAMILYGTENLTLMHGMAADDLVKRATRGVYATLWRERIPTEFVSPSGLASIPTSVRLVLLPAALLIDQATADVLQTLVANGITLVGFAKCAWVGGNGWSWPEAPGANLATLFGANLAEPVRGEGIHMVGVDEYVAFGLPAQAQGYWHQQAILPHPGTDILMTFSDGSAAITHHSFGKGHAYLVGTHLDAAALENPGAAQVLTAIARKAGLHAAMQVAPHSSPADLHLLMRGADRVVIATNPTNTPIDLEVTIPSIIPRRAHEILTNAEVAYLPHGDGVVIAFRIAAMGGVVVVLSDE